MNLLMAAAAEGGAHQVPGSIFTWLFTALSKQEWSKDWMEKFGFTKVTPDGVPIGMFWFDAIGFSLIAAIILVTAAFVATSKYQRVPRGLQNIMEAFVSFIRGIVRGFAGEQGDKYVPYLGTVFIFIFMMNMLGVLPGFRSPTMTLSTTAALGITTFIMVQSYAIRDAGLVSYVKHFMGDVLWLAPLMIVVEVIGELAKPMSLSLRLFGNIFGEDNVIEQLMMLGIGSPIPIPVQMPMYGFAIFTSFLQAFIFTTLSTIYIASKVVHEGGHGEHGHGEKHGDDEHGHHDEKAAHGHH